jgi:hypothetical protein
MQRSTTAASDAQPASARTAGGRVLCAYSPRWLSGPTPGYRGLCATWDGDEVTAEHNALRSN